MPLCIGGQYRVRVSLLDENGLPLYELFNSGIESTLQSGTATWHLLERLLPTGGMSQLEERRRQPAYIAYSEAAAGACKLSAPLLCIITAASASQPPAVVVHALPLCTSFCSGQSERMFVDAQSVDERPWYNLNRQVGLAATLFMIR